MKDLTHLVLLREKTTIQKCQYQMIAKMNNKFQSGLKILSKAIQPIKNVISDPLLTSEIECAAVMLRCITDDSIDYVKI